MSHSDVLRIRQSGCDYVLRCTGFEAMEPHRTCHRASYDWISSVVFMHVNAPLLSVQHADVKSKCFACLLYPAKYHYGPHNLSSTKRRSHQQRMHDQ